MLSKVEMELPRLSLEDHLGRRLHSPRLGPWLLREENLTQGDVEFARSSFMSDVFQDPALYINLNKRPEDDYESTDFNLMRIV